MDVVSSARSVCFLAAGQEHGVVVDITGLSYSQVLGRASLVLGIDARCAYDINGSFLSDSSIDKVAHGSVVYFSAAELPTAPQPTIATNTTSSILCTRLQTKLDKFVVSLGPNPDVFSEWRAFASELRAIISRQVPHNHGLGSSIKGFITPVGTVSEQYKEAADLPIGDLYAQHCLWLLLQGIAAYQRQTEEGRAAVESWEMQCSVAMGA